MKFQQVSLLALVVTAPVSLSAWAPVNKRQRGAASTFRPFAVHPLHLSPGNSTSDKDPSARGSSAGSGTSNEPQDVNPEAFAADLDQELDAADLIGFRANLQQAIVAQKHRGQ